MCGWAHAVEAQIASAASIAAQKTLDGLSSFMVALHNGLFE
jgi:hypothetical protein